MIFENSTYFYQCSQLKRIAFEKGAKLKIIPQSVFANLNSLTAIEIPASIELIEDGAFADCHSLTVITFEKNSNLKAIGNSAFESIISNSFYLGTIRSIKQC